MKKIKRAVLIILVISVFTIPLFASAQTFAPQLWPTGFWGPLVSCVGNYSTSTSNPSGLSSCTSLCDLFQTFINVIYFGISILIFIIAPILFAWGGFMFMVSRGKPEGISKARRILMGTLVAVIIVLCGWLLVNTLVSKLGISDQVLGFGNGTCIPPAMPTEATSSSSPNCGLDSFGDCIDLNNAGGNCMVDNNGNCVLNQGSTNSSGANTGGLNCPGNASCPECGGANPPAYCTCPGNAGCPECSGANPPAYCTPNGNPTNNSNACSCSASISGALVTQNLCNQAASNGFGCTWDGSACNCSGVVPGVSESSCNPDSIKSAMRIPSVLGVTYTANCTWQGSGQ